MQFHSFTTSVVPNILIAVPAKKRKIAPLSVTHPEIAAQADGWDPKSILSGTHSKLSWRCPNGHVYLAPVAFRTSRNSGCNTCNNHVVVTGFNDLATTHPDLSKEADGWDSTSVVAGHAEKKSWKCQEGQRWRAVVSSRALDGVGCPSCAKYGFNPNSDGYLYFLIHPELEMLQIGITNVPDVRLGRHKRSGWQVLEMRGPMDGHLAQQWETAILRMLKAKGADLSNEKISGKFDGYSEAWSKSTFEVKSIKKLMRLTEEFEEKK